MEDSTQPTLGVGAAPAPPPPARSHDCACRAYLAAEHDVGSLHVDALTAATPDVGFVVGIQFLLKLVVAEVEVEMLIRFSSGRETVAVQVRDPDADEGSWRAHDRMMWQTIGGKKVNSRQRREVFHRQKMHLAIPGPTHDAISVGSKIDATNRRASVVNR